MAIRTESFLRRDWMRQLPGSLQPRLQLACIKKAKTELVPAKEDLSILRNDVYESWAHECADKSVTLVKNNENVLPISPEKTKRILLEILGDYPSSARVTERWKALLGKRGI